MAMGYSLFLLLAIIIFGERNKLLLLLGVFDALLLLSLAAGHGLCGFAVAV